MPQISVIVPTRNRSQSLAATLDSLSRQSLAADHEIVVVDNGSHDDTPELVQKLILQIKNLRYVLEPEPGVSRAQNAGVRATTAPLVAFIDDDAIALESWLERIVETFEAHPDAWAVGGRVELVWPDGEPRWVPASFRSLYSHVDLGNEPRPVHPPRTLFSVNLAFRREAFTTLGGFSPALGRLGDTLRSGGEGEMCYRVQKAGKTLLYDPSIVVQHHVLQERVHKSWLIRRGFAQGRSRALRALSRGEHSSRLSWVMFALRSFLAALLRGNVPLITKVLTARATSADLMQRVVGACYSVGCTLESLSIVATNRRWVIDPDVLTLYGPSDR
jgi:glycosyltransferase involved in cell wall biosynthesis